jgi:hypothetical protein
LLGLYSELIQAQVINFDVPGGAGAVNYSGQGAYSDPGKNYWNPIVGGGTTGATNRLSDGVTLSPITLMSQMGGTFGSQGAQGTPAGLQQLASFGNILADEIRHGYFAAVDGDAHRGDGAEESGGGQDE